MATPRAMSNDELLSSPDPLNASRDESYLPSSRRVTRSVSQVSHRYMSLGASNSPRKQTIAVDIGSAKTPQRLFVTLETENDDQNRIARTLFPSSTPARRTRRKSTAATTKSVPLRDEDAPGAITPKRRGRGKRNSTPMKQTPGRSKRAKTTETDDSESDATSRPAPASTAGRKKTSATPKKRAATPKKTATSQKKTPQRRSARILDLEEESMSDATVLSELSNITTPQSKKRKAQTAPEEDTSSLKQTTKRATGKARRMALIPEEIERIAEPVLDSVENVHVEQNTRTEPIAEEPATEPAASLVYEPQTSEDPLTSDAIVDNTATTHITAGAPTKDVSTESWISERRSSTPVEDNGWDAQHSVQQEELESKPETESIDQNDATAGVASSQEPTPQDQSMMQVESGIQNELEDEQHVQLQAPEPPYEQQEEEKEAAPEPDMWLAMSDAAGGPPSDFSDDAPPDDGPDDHSDINDDAPAETVADQFSDDEEAAARPALDDTVAQGEDFSMIFAASIPSLRGSLGVRPNETMEFGEETSFIISQTLESFRKSRAGEETAAQNEGSPDLSYDHSRVVQEQGNGRDDDRDEGRRDGVQDVESDQADQDEAQGDSTKVDDLPVLPVLSQQAPTTSQAQLDLNSEWSEAPDEVLEAAVPREHQQGGDERSPVKRYRPAARISSPEMSALYEDPFLDIAEKQAVAQAPSSLARRLFSSSRKLQSQTAASSPAEPTPRPLARQSLARQMLSSAQKSTDVDSSPVRSVAHEDEFPEVPDNVLAAFTPAKSQYLYSKKPSASGSAAKSTSLGDTMEMTDAESAASSSGPAGGRSALSPTKRHLSPSLARSSPRRKSVPLSRQLFNSKVQEARHADIDDNVGAIPIELTGKATPNVNTDHDESAAYNDSWSEIPEDVLHAAVPEWYLAQRKAEERAKNIHEHEKDILEHGAHDVSLMDEEDDDEDVQNWGSVEDRVGEDNNPNENDMHEELSEEEAFEEDVQDEAEKEDAYDDAQMDYVDNDSAHDDIATEGTTTQKDIAAASSPRSRAASVASTQGRLPTPELTSSPLDSTVISHHDRNGTAPEPAAGDTLPELPAATSNARPTLDVLVTEPEAQQKSTPTAPELSSQRTSQDTNMLAPRSASAELGHRPSLSPIVRAGLALQSVTSEASSPISRQNSLGSPFRPATNATPGHAAGRSIERPNSNHVVPSSSKLSATETPKQRPTTSADQSASQSGAQFTGARKGWFPPLSNILQAGAKFFSPTAVTSAREQASLESPAAKPVARDPSQSLNRMSDSFASGREQEVVASSSDSDSLHVAPPNEEESSWMVDEQSPAAAPREETVFQHQATSPSLSVAFGSVAGNSSHAREPSVVAPTQDPAPHETAAGEDEDEEDIWEVEAQRDTPQGSRQQSFGKRSSVRGTGSLRQKPFGTSPRKRHHPYAKARPVVPSPWTKAGKENEPLGDEVTGLTPAKRQAAEAARSAQKSAQSSRQNKMLSFFSSPALLPGMENAQAALERKRRDLAAQEEAANRPAESPIHVLQTSNTMFPTVPFKSANPFANARAPAPSSLRKSVLAPSTPDRSQVQSRGKSTQKSLGVSKLSFAPTQSATPVRMHLSHADIEKWQEDSALEESSSSPDHRLRFLRTLPPKNASPSKSAMRSPLKARTPGPVVEWDSGVESPMTQAQKRFERELEQAAVDDFARRQREAQHSATRKSVSRQRTASEVATHDDDVSNEDVNEEDARHELVGDDDNNVEMTDAPSVETEEELSSSPPRTQLASNQPRESSQQRGLSIELELQLQRERMEQHALERQEALRRQNEEIELANQQRLEEEKRAQELKEIERERYRKQAVAEWDQPLSRTVWGDTHYRYMHRLIKMRRKGPFNNYVFPEDFERRTGWLMGQTVFAHDETQQTLVLNAWHLNVIDVFMSEVKGVWDELELAIRLFSIVVMERLREEWHLPLDEIRKAMVAQRAALVAQAEAAANAQEVAEDDYEDDEEYSGV
ncbi:hypothetical protein HYQ45_018117 [Verticillium longisporum]|uniref:Uncharacterized protein n=1 Tax=Verticillium longisporum TaxID=100787 RepID=A0A8I2Z1T9_VERLO|nr:hypothetical protein HYQ45_018117 [Verticillium longisporum]